MLQLFYQQSMKNLIFDDVHHKSKACGLYSKKITIVSCGWNEGKKLFTELYEFFSSAYGSASDIDTQNLLNSLHRAQQWSYQIDVTGYNHKFFLKNSEQYSFFILKYGDRLTTWTR
jgi:hypothetical protein